MGRIILKAENISKQYRLGVVGTGTLSHDLNRWWHKMQGKEDPYLKIGAVNDRSAVATEDYVWALRDISFEVQEGEVLGIIGKNGAGKSTLLKILSRVTSPTTGVIKSRGRIASLLEVGTGFHPELTGKENIFLNGAILGMTKTEITSKIDEIIAFSGCEMYIDTPVKRYSSGMRVRLAFAVAAHLEPDILVIDEVLAVGDADFQKKAIGKMQDITRGQGRTVLFVSHNMAAVEDLCTNGMLISNGQIEKEGDVKSIINYYLVNQQKGNSQYFNETYKEIKSKISKISILNEMDKEVDNVNFGRDFKIMITIDVKTKLLNPIISCRISNSQGMNIVTFKSNDHKKSPLFGKLKLGFNEVLIKVNGLFLLDDFYELSVGFADGKEVLDVLKNVVCFEVVISKHNDDLTVISKENSSNSILFHEAIWKIQ